LRRTGRAYKPGVPAAALQFLAATGRAIGDGLSAVGQLSELGWRAWIALWRDPQRREVLMMQCFRVGWQSLPVAVVTGVFLGLVLAVQSYGTLVRFNAETMCGSMSNYAIASQLAPAFTALLFAGRVGSHMAAELGAMKVTEQLDALRVMGTDPVAHLVAPRAFAATLLLPMLTAVAGGVGMYAAATLCCDIWGVDRGAYWAQTQKFLASWDIIFGLVKATVFGGLIAIAACRQGLATRGGATGVGSACTAAVVQASVMVLIANFVLTLVGDKAWSAING
jgi:phospholipid/cholesterol/gamma-HCH transport system permease protein